MIREANPTYNKKNPNEITIQPLTIQDARLLCEWRYESPFHIYNLLPWDKMTEYGIEFGDSFLRQEQYAAIIGSQHELIGFAQFFPMENVTRIGMGLRPDLCGQGLGSYIARLVAMEALCRKPNNEIDLEVLTWNSRAIRAYERAGFYINDTYNRLTPHGICECHCMVYTP